MLKKSLSLLLVLILVIGALAGCGGTEKKDEGKEGSNAKAPATEEKAAEEKKSSDEAAVAGEQKLVWNIGSEPKTLDPGLNEANDGGDVINNLFEGLMREVNGKMEPATAESYTMSDDKLTYTFKIRSDAKWSDGKKVTANDFEYSWKRVLDPETASAYSWIFSEANVETFKAIDEATFEVKLKAPTPYFVGLTSFYTFFPVREDAVNSGADGAWAVDPEKALGNGPFKLTAYTNGDRLVMEKNTHYWNAGTVKLERIEGLMIVDEATALTGYESGQIDIVDQMPNAEIPRLLAEDPTFMILPQDGVYYYSLNTKVKPLDDARVRRALNLAIDRTAIVETVTKGGQIPATTLVSQAARDDKGNVFAVEAGDYGIPVDLSGAEEAKKLLADAGYPNGEGFPKIEIMYNTLEAHKSIAEAIQEMWKQTLNIDVTLTNQEWAVFQDTRKQFNFDVARCGWIGDYSDPMTYLGMFVSESPMNYSQWKSEEYDALIEQAKTQAPEERFASLYKAHDLVMKDGAYIPLYYYTDPVMVAENVNQWEKTSRNMFYFGNVEMLEK